MQNRGRAITSDGVDNLSEVPVVRKGLGFNLCVAPADSLCPLISERPGVERTLVLDCRTEWGRTDRILVDIRTEV
jgi:hypothetical protein